MTATAPISYANAQIACSSALVALRTAGPAACKVSPSVYVPMLSHLEQAAELLGIHAQRVAAKAAEKGVTA